jgi:hypothetical protein
MKSQAPVKRVPLLQVVKLVGIANCTVHAVALMAKIMSPVEPVSTAPKGAYALPSSWYHELLGAPGGFPLG